MFQPGEEGLGGAQTMIEEGLLDAATRVGGERPTGALAVHIGTRYPTGEVHLRPGPEMASTDVIRITVHGRGGHASAPHLAVDPIAIAAEIVLALQAMVTRRIDVFDQDFKPVTPPGPCAPCRAHRRTPGHDRGPASRAG